MIGLLADSHGDLEKTRHGIAVLQGRGTELIYHLGDVGDSLQGDTLGPLLDFIRNAGVLAVKGNNDFTLETTLRGDGRIAAALRDLPIKREKGDLSFSHSFPRENFRALYDPVDDGTTAGAELLFREASFRIHFCGHSHRPVLFRWREGVVTREAIPPGPTALVPAERYIIVVGSVQEGELGLFGNDTYERITQEGIWK